MLSGLPDFVDRESKDRMKILFIIPTLRGGGAERVFALLGDELAKRGHQITIALKSFDGQNASAMPSDVKVLDGKGSWLRLVLLFFLIRRRQDFDVAISTLDAANSFLFLLVWFRILNSSLPRVHRQADLVKWPSGIRGFIFKKTLLFSFKSPCFFLANSESTLQSLEAVIPIKNKVLGRFVIGNPLSTPSRQLHDACGVSKKEEVTIRDKIKLVCVSRFAAKKRIHLAIEVVRVLRDKGFDVSLDIFGTGAVSETERLKSLVIGFDLAEFVRFRGYSDHLWQALTNFDVLLHPSEFEGFGNVVLEGMAAGLQIVICANSGMPVELTNNGRLGFVSETASPEDLAQAVLRAHVEPVPRSKLKNRAKDFDLQGIASEYERVLASIANAGSIN